SGAALRIEGDPEVPGCRPSPRQDKAVMPRRISAAGGCMLTTSAAPGCPIGPAPRMTRMVRPLTASPPWLPSGVPASEVDAAASQRTEQLERPEPPGRDLVGQSDPVDQAAEARAGDGHDVSRLVGEARPRRAAVLHRREERSGEQHRPVGIVMGLEELARQLLRRTADLAHVTLVVELETVVSGHRDTYLGGAQV